MQAVELPRHGDARRRGRRSAGRAGGAPPPRCRGRARSGRRGRRRASGRSPSAASATDQTPSSLSASIVFATFVTRAIGQRSTAPADAFATAGVTPTARSFGMTTPCAPSAWAERMIGAEVVRVLDPVEDDEERRPPARAARGEQVADARRSGSPRRRRRRPGAGRCRRAGRASRAARSGPWRRRPAPSRSSSANAAPRVPPSASHSSESPSRAGAEELADRVHAVDDAHRRGGRRLLHVHRDGHVAGLLHAPLVGADEEVELRLRLVLARGRRRRTAPRSAAPRPSDRRRPCGRGEVFSSVRPRRRRARS